MELENFAFKGIPDVRSCHVQDADILEKMVNVCLLFAMLSSLHCVKIDQIMELDSTICEMATVFVILRNGIKDFAALNLIH